MAAPPPWPPEPPIELPPARTLELVSRPRDFNPALLRALVAVQSQRGVPVAP
ncbi:MAG: hypothetical protein WBP81_21550 [Solirubrobacteraceae bacterium]